MQHISSVVLDTAEGALYMAGQKEIKIDEEIITHTYFECDY